MFIASPVVALIYDFLLVVLSSSTKCKLYVNEKIINEANKFAITETKYLFEITSSNLKKKKSTKYKNILRFLKILLFRQTRLIP